MRTALFCTIPSSADNYKFHRRNFRGECIKHTLKANYK